ncbi:conjugal transfer protein TraX [Enterobacteriaceae bacterium H11S18]|uniref:conjugal transfer protein TraX n=1 Tax=Dryocola clanedunensis TaxID=2925396 RepID=UPI0022F096AC|nr:conjugal transfer protein TraX [Dryocola clanedunensis]MCT4709254.1 conjugal transfer protein TraX [Dryocola clanedunensis]
MNEKQTPSGRLRKGAWWAANIVLPLSDARYTASKIPAALNQFRRPRAVLPSTKTAESLPELSFDEAIAASGMSVETLAGIYLRRKRFYLVLFYLAIALVCLLLATGMLAQVTTPEFWLRMATMCIFLLSAAALVFVSALITGWRLWQLRNRRLSPPERGVFTDFIADSRWLADTLSFR